MADERKRAAAGGQNIGFARSKRVLRSPEVRGREDLIAEDVEEGKHGGSGSIEMSELRALFQDMKRSFEERIDDMKEELRGVVREFKQKEEKWDKERAELMQRVSVLEKREERREREKRRNNILISGKDFGEGDVGDRVKGWLLDELKTDTVIKKAFKIKKDTWLVEMNEGDREKVMKTKSVLRGGNIFINQDLTEAERKIQKQIRDIARTQRAKGQRVTVGYRKLLMDDQSFKWDDMEQGLVPVKN